MVYAQTWRFGFVQIDDPIEVSENLRVRQGLSWQNLIWCFSSFFDGNWIPLTWLSLMFDTTVYGFRAGGYHFTNVVLHVANTLVLFAILGRATCNELRSACVAALFALHPLHVESVAWITERKDVLSTLFGLLSLLAYVNYAARGRSWRLAACLLCFLLSLLSKPTLVTLPCVFLLLDFWPLSRLSWNIKADWKRLVEKAPFLTVSVAFSVITILAQGSGHAVRSFGAFSLAARCENAVVVYAAYLVKTLFPHDLVVYYPHPGGHFAWPAIGGAAAMLLAISAAAVVWVRRYPFLFVGWAWYLGTLVPMIGIVQVGGQQMADRYTYFALIGPFLAVVWLVAELVPAGTLAARVLPVATLIVLAALTATAYVQVGYWRDDLALWGHALEGRRTTRSRGTSSAARCSNEANCPRRSKSLRPPSAWGRGRSTPNTISA